MPLEKPRLCQEEYDFDEITPVQLQTNAVNIRRKEFTWTVVCHPHLNVFVIIFLNFGCVHFRDDGDIADYGLILLLCYEVWNSEVSIKTYSRLNFCDVCFLDQPLLQPADKVIMPLSASIPGQTWKMWSRYSKAPYSESQ